MSSRIRAQLLKWGGPLSGLLTYQLMDSKGIDPAMSKTAGLLVWMAFWWVTEAVSIYVTSLLPLVLLPLLGVMKMKEVAPNYTHEIIFLFIGGFLFAFALEKWNLHTRIALKIILSVGKSPSSVLFGVMFSAYFISMWINNTATTAMLLPAVLAISAQLEKDSGIKGMATPLLIGLAFAASIGGMATMIGTAPNMIFMKEYYTFFPDHDRISFAQWMSFGIPISLLIFFSCFFVLKWLHRNAFKDRSLDLQRSRENYRSLGSWTYEEKWMGFFFVSLVLLWFFLADLSLGSLNIPGWPTLLGLEGKVITEATVAMAIVFILFFIPSGNKEEYLLEWKDVQRLPIGIIFLFGGGFAISQAVDHTGLSDLIAGNLSGLRSLSPFVLVVLLCLFMVVLSEFASNTASLQLVFPILATFAATLDCHPLQILIPATLAASVGFMLPIATPPNTIVFSSEKIRTGEMICSGFWVDLAGVLVISLATFTLLDWLLVP